MIDSQDFRDGYVSGVSIQYGSETSTATATLSIRDSFGTTRQFQIDGLSDFSICEDFRSLAIAQCTLIVGSSGVYLSLDPYTEGSPSDRDNFYFRGKTIGQV
jgi:hypothetical protein